MAAPTHTQREYESRTRLENPSSQSSVTSSDSQADQEQSHEPQEDGGPSYKEGQGITLVFIKVEASPIASPKYPKRSGVQNNVSSTAAGTEDVGRVKAGAPDWCAINHVIRTVKPDPDRLSGRDGPHRIAAHDQETPATGLYGELILKSEQDDNPTSGTSHPSKTALRRIWKPATIPANHHAVKDFGGSKSGATTQIPIYQPSPQAVSTRGPKLIFTV